MPDPFLERMQRAAKIRQRIDKLMRTAERHPETHEGQTARAMAVRLAEKHGMPLSGDSVGTAVKPRLNPGAFAAFGAAIRKNYPGQIDASDLIKPKGRVVDKEEDLDDEGY